MAFLSSLNISNKLLNMGGGSWNLRIYSQSVTHVSDSGNFDQHLRVWAILRDGALILWCLGHLCGFSVTSQLTLGCPVGVGNWCYWQRSTCLVSGIKCRLTLFYHLCLGWGSATGEDIMLNRALRTPSQFLHFQNSWRKSCLIKWVVTCPDPNTQRFCVLGQVICSALHEQVARLHEFFERISSHDLEKEMATHSSILAWRIPWTWWAAVHGVARSRTWLSD